MAIYKIKVHELYEATYTVRAPAFLRIVRFIRE